VSVNGAIFEEVGQWVFGLAAWPSRLARWRS
jgi:hypothetical protein